MHFWAYIFAKKFFCQSDQFVLKKEKKVKLSSHIIPIDVSENLIRRQSKRRSSSQIFLSTSGNTTMTKRLNQLIFYKLQTTSRKLWNVKYVSKMSMQNLKWNWSFSSWKLKIHREDELLSHFEIRVVRRLLKCVPESTINEVGVVQTVISYCIIIKESFKKITEVLFNTMLNLLVCIYKLN